MRKAVWQESATPPILFLKSYTVLEYGDVIVTVAFAFGMSAVCYVKTEVEKPVS